MSDLTKKIDDQGKPKPDQVNEDLVCDLLGALGLILFATHLHALTKSELIRILHNVGLDDTAIAALYSAAKRRVIVTVEAEVQRRRLGHLDS